MNMNEILFSPGRLASFLREEGLSLKKRFGQNFLADRNVALKIQRTVPFRGQSVIEIGPGLGNITHLYLDQVGDAVLIEVDKGLCRCLQKQLSEYKNITLLHADFLKLDLAPYLKKGRTSIFFSNLPYRTAAPILVRLLRFYPFIKELYIMLPELFRERLIHPEGICSSRLGVLLNLHFCLTPLFPVKKGSFFPEPELDSFFLKLTPDPVRLSEISRPDRLPEILALLYSRKRKMLKSVLTEARDREKVEKFYAKRIDELNITEVIEIINAF